jgi:hypothetical protein
MTARFLWVRRRSRTGTNPSFCPHCVRGIFADAARLAKTPGRITARRSASAGLKLSKAGLGGKENSGFEGCDGVINVITMRFSAVYDQCYNKVILRLLIANRGLIKIE